MIFFQCWNSSLKEDVIGINLPNIFVSNTTQKNDVFR